MNLKSILNNKVVKAGSWYTLTELFLKGLMLLTIPIFTRLLTPADYGLVSLYITWVGIFTVLIGFNLNASITRAKYEFKDSFNNYVSSVIFLSLIIFIIYFILFITFKDFFLKVTGLSDLLFYFMVFQAYFAFIRLSLITKFRVEYKYKFISLISIFIVTTGIILSIFLILYVFESDKYIGKIIGDGILIIIFGFFFLVYLLKQGKELVNLKYWKYALFFSTPLIIHSLSGIANGQFDRLVINHYFGESLTGIYSFAYNIGMIIAVIVNSMDQAWAPWVYEKLEENKYKDIKKRAKDYRDIFTIIYGGFLLLSPEIVRIMADESYWEGLNLIPWIFLGYYFMFMYTMEVKVEIYHKKTSLLSLGTFLAGVINIILNLIFVPLYGAIAAAITTAISFLLLFIFHYLLTSRIIKLKLFGLKFHLISILYVSIITSISIVFQDMILIRIFGILVLLFLLYSKIKFKLK
ncbi:MAG: hypothetical protein FH758_06185 [Firmicutes bacterium]|nr:hypothetical protein [Bacillota bacterium]